MQQLMDKGTMGYDTIENKRGRDMRINRIAYFLVLIGWLIPTAESIGQPAGQEVRWLRVGSLRSWFSSIGSEIEIGRTGMAAEQLDGLIWPSQFAQKNHQVGKAFWIGTSNYYDRVLKTTIGSKVVCAGPRMTDPITEIMPVDFKMYGKFYSPNVTVDDEIATDNAADDAVDIVADTLRCDRMIASALRTSIGLSVTRKIMAFTQQNHDNYFITEYTFKNTGLVDKAGTIDAKTLTDVYFFWEYRYAFGEEGYRISTPSNNIGWGRNTVNHVFGTDPSAAGFDFRGFYAFYGKHSLSGIDDIGLPAYWSGGDGHLTGSQYAGGATLHADKSAQDKTDNTAQPISTPYIGSDDNQSNDAEEAPQAVNQYNVELMQRKYAVMKKGHYTKTHAELLGTGNADTWGLNPGGYAQSTSYGPYTLAVGESVRIVVAEGVSGLSMEKCYEVGRTWKDQAVTSFTLPNGSTTADRDLYKDEWVRTGIDSIKQTLKRAIQNFKSNYTIPQAPPPPSTFEVRSGGDRIRLTWTNDASSAPGFDGYKVYRAIGRPDTFYTEIFSCTKSTVSTMYDDTSARRGFDYYYYVVTKDDGSRNDIQPGIPLVSSKYYTMTNKPARLRRPAKTFLDSIRVVPNPFDARSRKFQFGTNTPDRIAFYGLPPACTIRIYTERGDLIKTLEHTDGSADEIWDSTTEYRQVVVSGVYIAVFSTPDGKATIRKFVIIR